MKKYKILVKGFMKKMEAFEDELNAEYRSGWSTKTITVDPNGKLVALLERRDKATH